MSNVKQKQRYRKDLVRHLVASIGVVVLTGLAADLKLMSRGETNLFRAINNWPDSLSFVFLVITQAGSQWMLFGLTLFLVAKRLYRPALRIFGGGVAAFLLAQAVKLLIMRPRPFYLLSDINMREPLLMDYGFPSAHTAVATTMALLIRPLLPRKLRWLTWVWIGLVALSRIYLGAHAPFDVVGGFAVGVAVVCLVYLVRGKLQTVRKITGMKLSD